MIRKSKSVALSILFYIAAWVLIVVFNSFDTFKSGPCTPNLDFLSIIVAIIFSAGLVVIIMIKSVIQWKRPDWVLLLIHIVGFGSYFLVGWLLN
ncbi:hypothetical protein LT679_06955 [Mucilaginibacter roseus]|uniref:Cardiolipin synthase N-terminal domain-containing protein n=1 Tax=Mucilaginibacter roseus TaxID=1528868 RepID=A0ABS8TZN9_9SPHI|nr:hypothetical protein [Mucilaginibacter roseus]MCD8740338.1 hypothetical protein [Mucilaginibacter roseus]